MGLKEAFEKNKAEKLKCSTICSSISQFTFALKLNLIYKMKRNYYPYFLLLPGKTKFGGVLFVYSFILGVLDGSEGFFDALLHQQCLNHCPNQHSSHVFSQVENALTITDFAKIYTNLVFTKKRL